VVDALVDEMDGRAGDAHAVLDRLTLRAALERGQAGWMLMTRCGKASRTASPGGRTGQDDGPTPRRGARRPGRRRSPRAGLAGGPSRGGPPASRRARGRARRHGSRYDADAPQEPSATVEDRLRLVPLPEISTPTVSTGRVARLRECVQLSTTTRRAGRARRTRHASASRRS
jgi:hypothetical protein